MTGRSVDVGGQAGAARQPGARPAGGRRRAGRRADRHHRHGLPVPGRRRRRRRRSGSSSATASTPSARCPPTAGTPTSSTTPTRTAPGHMNTRWGGFLDGLDQFDAALLRHLAARGGAHGPPAAPAAGGGLRGAGAGRSDARAPAPAAAPACSSPRRCTTTATASTPAPDDIDAYSVTGNAHCIIANRLSYLLDLRGPSVAVDTACSSSLVAVHLACQSLRQPRQRPGARRRRQRHALARADGGARRSGA